MTYQALIQSLGGSWYSSFNQTVVADYKGIDVVDTNWLSNEPDGVNDPVTNVVKRKYVADAPSQLGTTHSAQINGHSGSITAEYTSIQSGIGFIDRDFGGPYPSQGGTISFWYKENLLAGFNTGSTTLRNLFRQTVSANNRDIGITGGTYIDSGTSISRVRFTGGQFITDAQAASSFGNINSSNPISFNKWQHIAITISWNQTGVNAGFPDGFFERAIYIDGCLVATDISATNLNGWGSNWDNFNNSVILGTSSGPTDSATNIIKTISHFALFNKVLTRDEIRQLAWYGQSNSDYVGTVMAKSPAYFTTLNNPDKATPPDTYGTEANNWGVFNPNVNAILVNQEGKIGKAWSVGHDPTFTQTYSVKSQAAFRQSYSDIHRTGNYSIEFWAKTNYGELPLNPRQFMRFGDTGSNLEDRGYFTPTLASDGRITLSVGRKSGSTTWAVTTGPSYPSTYVAVDDATTVNRQHTLGNRRFRMADGEWHHFVVTITRTPFGDPNNYLIRIYADGYMTQTAASLSFGWANLTENISAMLIGNGTNATASTNRTVFFDKFAMYPRALSQAEVHENFMAGMIYQQAQTGVVKYWDGDSWNDSTAQKVWNGTAWIDWDHRYWDGTQWISL